MKKRIILLGAGGHAKVVADIFRETAMCNIYGCLGATLDRSLLQDIPILGGDELLPSLFNDGIRAAFVAIGDNKRRREATVRLKQLGFSLVNAISSRATVSSSVHMGEGIAVMPGAIVNVDSVLGDGVIVNTAASVDHDCQVGDFVHVAPGSHLAGGVQIGEGCLIGIGSSVIPNISIGAWCKVGAGSVVVRNLPGDVTAFGVPARVKVE